MDPSRASRLPAPLLSLLCVAACLSAAAGGGEPHICGGASGGHTHHSHRHSHAADAQTPPGSAPPPPPGRGEFYEACFATLEATDSSTAARRAEQGGNATAPLDPHATSYAVTELLRLPHQDYGGGGRPGLHRASPDADSLPGGAAGLYLAWVASLDTWSWSEVLPPEGGGQGTPNSITLRCDLPDGMRIHRTFRNPRIVVEENPTHSGHAGDGDVTPPGMTAAESLRVTGHDVMVIPCGAVQHAVCSVGSTPVAYGAVGQGGSGGRSAAVLQATAGVQHATIQAVGPAAEVNNLVLVSAGYTAAEQAKFIGDANEITQLFKFPPVEYKDSVPFYRYFDTINVFSVFQASAEAGASKPLNGLSVNNNLDCTYGTTQPRFLFCDLPKSLALAETSPAKPKTLHKGHTIVTVLVNDAQYGGGGLFSANAKLACFYNGLDANDPAEKKKYASLLFHELGHAWGDLFDEYDMAIEEPSVKPLKNCVAPSVSPIPWQAWIDKSKTEQSLGVLETPIKPCGYSNYLRPTADCIMDKLDGNRMCPICREAVTKQIYSTVFSLIWPACPLPDEIVHLLPGQVLTLHTNRKLLSKGEFDITWQYANSTSACPGGKCFSYLDVSADTLSMGTTVVSVTITDKTSWVLESMPQMTQTRNFTIKKVPAINNSTGAMRKYKCYCADESMPLCRGGASFFEASSAREQEPSYVAECADGGNCTVDFTTTAYEQADAGVLDEHLSQYDKPIFYALLGAGVAALMLWVKLCLRWRNKLKHKANPIFQMKFKRQYLIIRNIMMVTAVVIMLASLGTYGYALYLYTQVDGLGKWLLLPGAIGALILYIVAFLGFKAAFEKSMCWLAVNGIVLLLCIGFCIALAYYARWFSDSVGDPDHGASRFLKDTWESLVRDNPGQVCTLQRLLKCSGFTENCQRLSSTLHCPDKCDNTNAKYPDACKKSLEEKIEEYSPYVFTYSIVLGVLLLIGVVFNFTLCYALRGMQQEVEERKKQKMQGRRQSLASHQQQPFHPASGGGSPGGSGMGDESGILLMSLTKPERQELAKQFQKVDRRGDGMISQREFKRFMKEAMQVRPTDAETDKLFRVAGATSKEDRIQFRDVLDCLKPIDESDSEASDHPGWSNASKDSLLRQSRKEEIREYLRSVYKGESVREEYRDHDHLPQEERDRRLQLREMYAAGVRYGADTSTYRVHQLDLTQESVGLEYDSQPGIGVAVVAVTGAAAEADLLPGDVVTKVGGRDIRTHHDLSEAISDARASGMKYVTLTTRQPFPRSVAPPLHESDPPAGRQAKEGPLETPSSSGADSPKSEVVLDRQGRTVQTPKANFSGAMFGGGGGGAALQGYDFNPLRPAGRQQSNKYLTQGHASASPLERRGGGVAGGGAAASFGTPLGGSPVAAAGWQPGPVVQPFAPPALAAAQPSPYVDQARYNPGTYGNAPPMFSHPRGY